MNVVVHSTPRTGGFSVRYYFDNSLLQPCFHVHYMQNKWYYIGKRNLWHTAEKRGRETFKVICTIRDPVARNLSEYYRLNFIDGPGKPDTLFRKVRGLQKKGGTPEQKFYGYIDHFRQHHFLGSEIVPFWGVNIFKRGWTAPYRIYDRRLLVIRCEDLSEYGPQAFYELTGLQSDDPMPHKNVVPVKRKPMKLTEQYIDAMYREKWFPRFFYSDEEIEGFKAKWSEQIDTGTS